MNDNATLLESLLEKAEDYGKTTIELFKLNAIDKSADVISSLIARVLILFAVALFILILNIGIALWLGEMLGKNYYGFFIIAGFYAFMVILFNIFRHQWIKLPISNSIISHLRKQKLK